MFSIIIPIYNEKDNISSLNKKIFRELENFEQSFEIIYVDDGSKDGSFDILKNLYSRYKNIKVVRLAKNFGQTQAFSAGLSYSKSDVIIFMDADLQNDPSDIPKLISKLNQGYDVISGWRRNRKDPLFTRRLPSKIANFIISHLTGLKLHDYGCSLKIYKREVLQKLEFFGEAHRILPAFAYWIGYRVGEMEVKHHKRLHGKSKYGLLRTFKVILDLISAKFFTSYSTRPDYIFGGFGILLILLGILVAIWTFIINIERGILFSTLIISMGVQLILMGLLADILVRIYHSTTRSNTKYIVSKVIGERKD